VEKLDVNVDMTLTSFEGGYSIPKSYICQLNLEGIRNEIGYPQVDVLQVKQL
jgi:hypothetical protein